VGTNDDHAHSTKATAAPRSDEFEGPTTR
jgi:hypothetical protein